MDGLVIDIHEPHDRLEKCRRRKKEETLHGLINMLQGHHNAEAVKLSFCTVKVWRKFCGYIFVHMTVCV